VLTPIRHGVIAALSAAAVLVCGAAGSPARAAAPERSGYGLTGENYAFITAVHPAGRRVTFNLIAWFTGAAATRACRQDGVPISDVEWCHDYYYRDRDDRLRSLPVDPDAPITAIDRAGDSEPAALADLPTMSDRPYRLTITRGRITAIDQIYVP
jgi:hypothetical protein